MIRTWGLLLMLTLAACAPQKEREPDALPRFDAASAVHVKVWDIADEFRANQVAANSRYASASIILEGPVGSVEEGEILSHGPEIHFNPWNVIAFVSNRGSAAELAPEDSVTLACVGAQSRLSLTLLSNCHVTSVEKAGSPQPSPAKIQKPIEATGAYTQTNDELKRQWLVLNEECRGGQHSPDDAVCTERDNVGVELERRGICFSYSDWRVVPVDYDWHPCSQATPKGWKPPE